MASAFRLIYTKGYYETVSDACWCKCTCLCGRHDNFTTEIFEHFPPT